MGTLEKWKPFSSPNASVISFPLLGERGRGRRATAAPDAERRQGEEERHHRADVHARRGVRGGHGRRCLTNGGRRRRHRTRCPFNSVVICDFHIVSF